MPEPARPARQARCKCCSGGARPGPRVPGAPRAKPPAPAGSPPIKPRGPVAKVIRGALRDVNDDGSASPQKSPQRPQRPAGANAERARALAAREAAVRASYPARARPAAAAGGPAAPADPARRRPPLGARRRKSSP